MLVACSLTPFIFGRHYSSIFNSQNAAQPKKFRLDVSLTLSLLGILVFDYSVILSCQFLNLNVFVKMKLFLRTQ